jgi:hypothetical protein
MRRPHSICPITRFLRKVQSFHRTSGGATMRSIVAWLLMAGVAATAGCAKVDHEPKGRQRTQGLITPTNGRLPFISIRLREDLHRQTFKHPRHTTRTRRGDRSRLAARGWKISCAACRYRGSLGGGGPCPPSTGEAAAPRLTRLFNSVPAEARGSVGPPSSSGVGKALAPLRNRL